MRASRVLALALLLSLGACAGVPGARRLVLQPTALQAHRQRDGALTVTVVTPRALFERAAAHLAAGDAQRAAALYEQLLHAFPASAHARPAHYNLGLAHEQLRQFERASASYRALIALAGESPDAVDASFRLGACLAELRRWRDSADQYRQLLARRHLSREERIEAAARLGLALQRAGDRGASEAVLRQGLTEWEAAADRDSDPFFAAMARYYLAAAQHLAFRQVALDARQDLAAALEAKTRLLYLSQSRYLAVVAMREPHWSVAAGFQVGSLYREYYDALMSTVPELDHAARELAAEDARRAGAAARAIDPQAVAAARRELAASYLEQLHRRIAPVLQRSLHVFDQTTSLAERLGAPRNPWVAKCRFQLRQLQDLLTATPADAIRTLPGKLPPPPEDQPAIELDPPLPPRPPASTRAVM